MNTNLSQVIYRPPTHPSQSHHPAEFIVYVDLEAYNKWKNGKKKPGILITYLLTYLFSFD